MTLTQRRIQATEQAIKQHVTADIARNNLTKCGILTNKGNIASPYKCIFTRKDEK